MRNNVTFKAIASALEEKGYERTYQQCREKLKALKKKYKEAVDRLRTSGVGVESDDDLSQHEIYVNFKCFTQIHSLSTSFVAFGKRVNVTQARKVKK